VHTIPDPFSFYSMAKRVTVLQVDLLMSVKQFYIVVLKVQTRYSSEYLGGASQRNLMQFQTEEF